VKNFSLNWNDSERSVLMLGIGLDFGTTNSTVSIFDGKSITYINIDLASENQVVMPTAIYINKKFGSNIGTQAIKEYLDQNQGRLIQLEKESLGIIKVTHGETGSFKGREDLAGDTTVEVKIHAMVDKKMPGHLFKGLKRWLGKRNLETIKIFGINYRIVALITPILNYIRKTTSKKVQQKLSKIYIGRPIKFEGGEKDTNEIAMKKIIEACSHAEIPNPTFYPEPLGATLSYLYTSKTSINDIVLAFDFGGGTLDLSIIKVKNNGFDILATHGTPIGGDIINQLIYIAKVFPEMGKGTIVKGYDMEGPTERLFNFKEFEKGLINWQQTYNLNTEDNMDIINKALTYNSNDAKVIEKINRLKNVINWNYSYSVIKAVEQAKIELSSKSKSTIEVKELDLNIPITQVEFETIINDIVNEVEESINVVIKTANLAVGEIGHIISTGGSSQISIIKELLEKKFPGKVVQYDAFKSIAAGLSIASYHQYGFDA